MTKKVPVLTRDQGFKRSNCNVNRMYFPQTKNAYVKPISFRPCLSVREPVPETERSVEFSWWSVNELFTKPCMESVGSVESVQVTMYQNMSMNCYPFSISLGWFEGNSVQATYTEYRGATASLIKIGELKSILYVQASMNST